jgi:hypothetical protein
LLSSSKSERKELLFITDGIYSGDVEEADFRNPLVGRDKDIFINFLLISPKKEDQVWEEIGDSASGPRNVKVFWFQDHTWEELLTHALLGDALFKDLSLGFLKDSNPTAIARSSKMNLGVTTLHIIQLSEGPVNRLDLNRPIEVAEIPNIKREEIPVSVPITLTNYSGSTLTYWFTTRSSKPVFTINTVSHPNQFPVEFQIALQFCYSDGTLVDNGNLADIASILQPSLISENGSFVPRDPTKIWEIDYADQALLTTWLWDEDESPEGLQFSLLDINHNAIPDLEQAEILPLILARPGSVTLDEADLRIPVWFTSSQPIPSITAISKLSYDEIDNRLNKAGNGTSLCLPPVKPANTAQGPTNFPLLNDISRGEMTYQMEAKNHFLDVYLPSIQINTCGYTSLLIDWDRITWICNFESLLDSGVFDCEVKQ